MSLISKNPTTEEVTKTFEEIDDDALEQKFARGDAAYATWKNSSFSERAILMKKSAQLLRERKQRYSMLMTEEMGKPITAAIAEVEKCAWVCEYYAEHGERFLREEVIATDARESFVRFDPLGMILAVMPWNFPFWQVIRFAAPTLMAGNVGVLKHASNVPQCALAIEEVFRDAGFPEGVFQTLLLGSQRVECVIHDARVRAVTLTGSEHAGSQVAAAAGKGIKKTVLELGGSDPFIILDDADLSAACTIGTTARLQNAGQSCIAAKRFIVVASRYDECVTRFREQYRTVLVGDPRDEKTQMGPLATRQILEEVERQVTESVAQGAQVEIGGKRRAGKGYFYEPTVLSHVRKGMPAYDEEVFGPVAAMIQVHDADEAIAVANDTPYGLGASLWTQDLARAKQLARRIDAGSVFINGMVKSDPRLPFGGIKLSGYGRELSSYGMKEFVNMKTVWIGG